MRRQSRELALQILFQTEFAPEISLTDLSNVFNKSFDQQIMNYTHELVKTVQKNKERIDAKIQETSRHWKMERMASVDRNILRIAVAEVLFMDTKVEPKIVMNEAIEIAKVYGTQDSGSFVNGLLDQIIKNETN